MINIGDEGTGFKPGWSGFRSHLCHSAGLVALEMFNASVFLRCKLGLFWG